MKTCYTVLFLLGIAIPSLLWAQKPTNTEVTRSPSAIPSINEVIPVILEPQPINLEEVRGMLTYPDALLGEKLEGTVVVRILVDEKGDYMRHRIIASPHPLFSKVVNKHIKKLIFTPAVDNNRQEIKFWISVPIPFKMQDGRRGRNIR